MRSHFRLNLPKISVALSTFLNIPLKKVASKWKEEKNDDGAVVSPVPAQALGEESLKPFLFL